MLAFIHWTCPEVKFWQVLLIAYPEGKIPNKQITAILGILRFDLSASITVIWG